MVTKKPPSIDTGKTKPVAAPTTPPAPNPQSQSTTNPPSTSSPDPNQALIDHIFKTVANLNTTNYASVQAWLNDRGISQISQLLDMYHHDQASVADTSYQHNGHPENLVRYLSMVILLICKYSIYSHITNGTAMTDQDWLNLTQQEYDDFRTSSRLPTGVTTTTPMSHLSSPTGSSSSTTTQSTDQKT